MMVKNFSNVQKSMHYYHNRPKVESPDFELCEFDHPKLDLRKPVILHFGSNMGKTQFAKAHFKNPLVVSTKDGLKDFKEGWHDGIIFNDYRFNSYHKPSEVWTDNEIKHITDNEQTRIISCRHKDVKIPKEVPIIFIHNSADPYEIFPRPTNPQDEVAMKRRLGQIV